MVSFLFFSFSFQTASSGAQQLFLHAVPRETAELGICTFVKIYSMGIASNISILELCVLTRASVTPPLSQCFLLKETTSSKAP